MLSAVVITKNEQDRIKSCLESIKWVDEIIIIDNGSADDTLKIARQYTGKIFRTNLNDFASIRNLGFEKTSGEWVMYLDSDERVLKPLKDEIEAVISMSEFSAYALSRKNIIFGQEVNYGSYKYDWVIRLLKKKDFESWVGKIHEYPKFSGKLGYSKNSLLHLTHRNLDQVVLKSLEWSKIDAKLRLDANHPEMSAWRFLRVFLAEIFYQGILRKGFFNGTIGVIDSILQVFSLFLSYVRVWEMQRSESLDKTYDAIDKKLTENNFNYP